MDSQLSSAHRARELLNVVDLEWQCDSLSDDDLHIPDEAIEPQPVADDSDDNAAVLTDAQGCTWSLSLPANTATGSGSGSGARAPTVTLGAAMVGLGVGTAHASLESADGLRWTDLGLQAFAAQAAKQPPPPTQ